MKRKSTPKFKAEPLDLIALADDLGRMNSYYECTYLAVSDVCPRETVNAIQSVMLVAQEKLEMVIARVERELARQRLID
jgi:hypothetical protein